MLNNQFNFWIIMLILVCAVFSEEAFSDETKTDKATVQLKDLSASMKASDISQIRELINAGADVNVRNEYGVTPLYMASHNGQPEIVKLLLESKADANAAKKGGTTPLFVAVQDGHTEIVKLLLENKADINAARKEDGATPLNLASQFGYTEIVKLLLESKADVNAIKTDGTTSLYVASQENNISIVKLLLEAKADVNTAHKDGFTPLYMAAQLGHMEVVKLLLKAGADVTIKANVPKKSSSSTTREIAPGIQMTSGIFSVKNWEVDDTEEVTALDIAQQKGHTEIVKLIKEYSATDK